MLILCPRTKIVPADVGTWPARALSRVVLPPPAHARRKGCDENMHFLAQVLCKQISSSYEEQKPILPERIIHKCEMCGEPHQVALLSHTSCRVLNQLYCKYIVCCCIHAFHGNSQAELTVIRSFFGCDRLSTLMSLLLLFHLMTCFVYHGLHQANMIVSLMAPVMSKTLH